MPCRLDDDDRVVAADRLSVGDEHLGAVVDLGADRGDRRGEVAAGTDDDRDDRVGLEVGEGGGPRAKRGGPGRVCA